jgi:PE-PPE domain
MLVAGGVLIAASAGVTVSTPSATYSAAVRLLGTTIGVGPSFDGFGLVIPLAFFGSTVPEGDSFHTVPYPAQMTLSLPIISDLPGLSAIPYWPQSLKRSEEIGAGYLLQDVAATPAAADDKVTIIGASQGTMVAEIARTEMAKDPNYVANAQNYEFELIGDPYQPNGGLLTRFTSWSDLPVLGDLFPFGRPGPSDSPFKTIYYQNQYDGVADFPEYFNVLSIANAIVGMAFEHAFPGYALEYPDAANAVTTQVGNTTYVMLPQYLPLLEPLRIPASLIGAQRFVDAIDPVLRVFVEMGYDRTADPSQVKEFSWVTPAAKMQEALDELPGAFAQSMAILGGETYVPTLPQPVVSATEPVTPVTDHPVIPVDTSPWAQEVRHVVVDVAGALSDVTRPLAGLLQAIGRATSPQKTVVPVDGPAPADTKIAVNAGTPAKVDADHERKFTQFRALAHAVRSGKREPDAAPSASSESKHSHRAAARSARHAAKQTTKSAGARHRSSEHKSPHAS